MRKTIHNRIDAMIRGTDAAIVTQGDISSFTIYPLLIVVIYEVFMRYAFNTPTVWGFEVTAFLYGVHYMLGLSYMEAHDGHVKVDILTGRFSPKVQAVIGLLSYLLIFTPVFFLMTVAAIKFAYTSFASGELNSTSWGPRIWPFKIIMALSFFFLLKQGLANMLRHLRTLTDPDPGSSN